MMSFRLKRFYWLLLTFFFISLSVTTVLFFSYYGQILNKPEIYWLIAGLIGAILAGLALFVGLLIWERWRDYKTPRFQIKFAFLQGILRASKSCLLVVNKQFEIVWTSDFTWLKQILNHKKVLHYDLTRVDSKINRLKIGETIPLIQDYITHKAQYNLTRLESKLFLIHSNVLEYRLKDFFLRERPVFLILTVDEISYNLQEQNFAQSETQVLNQIQTELYQQLPKLNTLLFKHSNHEWILLTTNYQLYKFRQDNFEFLNQIALKIKEKFKLFITFSAGTHLGHPTVLQDETKLVFNDFNLADMYQKAVLARKMAQARGGDQIILTDVEGQFIVLGKQRDLPRLDTANIRNFYVKFFTLLKKYKNILIIGHKQADLDVFGGGVALSYFLKERFKEQKTIKFIVGNVAKETIKFIKTTVSSDFIKKHINFKSKWTAGNPTDTLLIVIDTNNPEFVDPVVKNFRTFDKIFIDHHINCFSGSPKLALIDSDFSSTSEMVLSLMTQINVKQRNFNFDPMVLKLILLGILIDTNNLQTQIGKNTLEAVNFIIKNGVNMEQTTAEINHFKTATTQVIDLNRANFSVQTIDKQRVVLQFHENYIVTSQTVAAVAEKYLHSNPVKLVFAIGHDHSGSIFLSGRSQPPYNVELICKKFGGGGDARRAAAQIYDNLTHKLSEVTQQLISEITAQKI